MPLTYITERIFIMNKSTIGCLMLCLVHGCASSPSTTPAPDSKTVKTHAFTMGSNKKLSFHSSGCKIGDGTLKNESDFASAGSYATLLVANSQTRTTIDQYRVSCAAVAAGGTSSCVIQRFQGSGRDKDYGGPGCPDMKFELINFRSF